MMKISEPKYTHDEVLAACRSSILDTGEQGIFDSSLASLALEDVHYRSRANAGQLYTFAAITGVNPQVVHQLKKSDMLKLYEYYFRNRNPGRQFYEALLAAANEKCPFCGGIGRPRNLDHYLPKGNFPQFSVLPINLIPSCRDCNMDGKGRSYSTTAETQILHPILEADHFFENQWISATHHKPGGTIPNIITYFVNPPTSWSAIDKARVHEHFHTFDIGVKYSTQASGALIEVEAQIDALRKLDPHISVSEVIFNPVINSIPFLNHWKRIMYVALKEKFG